MFVIAAQLEPRELRSCCAVPVRVDWGLGLSPEVGEQVSGWKV